MRACRGGGGAHRSMLTAARVWPWSPPASELRNALHSISLPQVPKKTSSTNLKEYIMVSSITLEMEHVMLTSFGVRTGTHGHEYELVKDVLTSKSPNLLVTTIRH
jgi:hypothetical protein